MNRKSLVKINLAALCTLFTLAAFGMHEGEAGPAPKETPTTAAATSQPQKKSPRKQPYVLVTDLKKIPLDYEVVMNKIKSKQPPFTFVSTDGKKVPIAYDVIMSDVNGKPISNVLRKAFESPMREKANQTITIDTKGSFMTMLFAYALTILYQHGSQGNDINSPEEISSLSERLQLFDNTIENHIELLHIANLYNVQPLVQACVLTLQTPAIIREFITNAKVYTSNLESLNSFYPHLVNTSIDGKTFNLTQTLIGTNDEIVGGPVAFSPDNQYLASVQSYSPTKLWHKSHTGLFDPNPETLEEAPSGVVFSIVFSPNSQEIASGSSKGTIKIWHKNPEEKFIMQQVLEAHNDMVTSVAFSPDGQEIANGSHDETIKVWIKKRDGQFVLQQTLKGHKGTVTSIVFSPNGQEIASGSLDSTIKIWAKNHDGQFILQQTLKTLEVFKSIVESIAFSPNGQEIASGSDNKTVKVWIKNHDGKFILQQTLEGHKSAVTSVAFSPSGQNIVSGSYDNTINIWHKHHDGKFTLQQTIATKETPFSVAFSPDNQQIVTGLSNGNITILQRDQQPISVSILQAMLIAAIKQTPNMILDLSKETESNLTLREIALSFIGTLAEEYVRDHVKMDWPAAAGAAGTAPMDTEAASKDKPESAAAKE